MKTPSLLALLLLSPLVHADECNQNQPVLISQIESKKAIKQALLILLHSKAITFTPEVGTQINRDLIEEMRKDGLLEKGDPKVGIICIDVE